MIPSLKVSLKDYCQSQWGYCSKAWRKRLSSKILTILSQQLNRNDPLRPNQSWRMRAVAYWNARGRIFARSGPTDCWTPPSSGRRHLTIRVPVKIACPLYEPQEWQSVPALLAIFVFADKDFFNRSQELHLLVADSRTFRQSKEGGIM